jgi:gamma-glutamyltranspeptidase/glutathione hydrolase
MDGELAWAWGTPGGDSQDQVNLQVFLNVVEFGMDVQQATDAAMFQILDFPPSFFPKEGRPGHTMFETRIAPETIAKLEAMGYQMHPAGEWSIGDGTALQVDRKRGVLFGAAGMRRNKSYAVGF